MTRSNSLLVLLILVIIVAMSLSGCIQKSKYPSLDEISGTWYDGMLLTESDGSAVLSGMNFVTKVTVEKIDDTKGKMIVLDTTYVKDGRPVNFSADANDRLYELEFDYDPKTGLIKVFDSKKNDKGNIEYTTELKGHTYREDNNIGMEGVITLNIIENSNPKKLLECTLVAKKNKNPES